MTDLSELKLYATRPHPCSYLDDREATTIFVDPDAPMTATLFSQLSEYGFRRSGHHIYRPHCAGCNACVPIRIPVEDFDANRKQRRCLKNNQDLSASIVSDIDDDEYYDLYVRYISLRHADGDMYPPSREQYRDFLTSEWGITQFVAYRHGNDLIAVSVADLLEDGISAIYAFFDPEQSKRSLGVYNILHQIQRARLLQLPYVYLGYWIKDCQKMRYKVEYKPFQVLIDNCWMTVRDYQNVSPKGHAT